MEKIHIGQHPQWHAFGLIFNADTIISAWVASAIIISLALFLRFALKRKPGYFQSMTEILMEGLKDMLHERLGNKGEKYLALIATIFIFILFSNWMGILPFELKPPTADLNTTVSLALLTIFLVQVFGVIEKGPLLYLKRFIEPYPVFLPLNIIEEIAKPVSLSVRLFGNIFSKETILVVLISLVPLPLIFPIPILALSLLIGAIQAYVFMLLSMFYIGAAIEGH